VSQALETMQQRKVRRLPVVAPDGTLEGVLSINDITVNAQETTGKKVPEISFRDLVQTYKAICAHALPVRTWCEEHDGNSVTAVSSEPLENDLASMDHKKKIGASSRRAGFRQNSVGNIFNTTWVASRQARLTFDQSRS